MAAKVADRIDRIRLIASCVLVCTALALAAASAGCPGAKDRAQARIEQHQQLQRLERRFQRCVPGDRCVIGPGSMCWCPRPLNAKHREAWRSALRGLDCGDATYRCRVAARAACVRGRCVEVPARVPTSAPASPTRPGLR